MIPSAYCWLLNSQLLTNALNSSDCVPLAICADERSFLRGPVGSRRHRGQSHPIRAKTISRSVVNHSSQVKTHRLRAQFTYYHNRMSDFGKDKNDEPRRIQLNQI